MLETSCWETASASEPKNRVEMTVKNCFLFKHFEVRKSVSLKQFQS